MLRKCTSYIWLRHSNNPYPPHHLHHKREVEETKQTFPLLCLCQHTGQGKTEHCNEPIDNTGSIYLLANYALSYRLHLLAVATVQHEQAKSHNVCLSEIVDL